MNPQRPHHLLKYLSQKHEITALCVNAWWLEEKQDEYVRMSLKNIDIYYMSENKLNPIRQEISVMKRLKDLKKKSDIESFDVHIGLNSLISSYLVTKELALPSIFDICDDIIGWLGISPQVPAFLKPLGKIAGSFLLKKNIKMSSRITYTAESLKSSCNLPQNKSYLIPNGVDTNLFYRRNGKIKEKLNLQDEFVLGFVGSLGEWVDLKTVFKAVKMLKDQVDIKMIIVGDGSRFLDFRRLSEKYGIQNHVVFTGNVPYSEVPEYTSCMSVCLLPFDTSDVSQNALPLKLFEYMACEKPVISSPILSVKNAVGDMAMYASNPEELRQCVLRLYHDEELRRELGRKGREFVKENYSWDKICSKFENIIIGAVESRGQL